MNIRAVGETIAGGIILIVMLFLYLYKVIVRPSTVKHGSDLPRQILI